MLIDIRAEETADVAAVHALNLEVFPTPGEAVLVDQLKADGGVPFKAGARDW